MSDLNYHPDHSTKSAFTKAEGAERRVWTVKPLRLLMVQVLLVDISQVAVRVTAREPVCHGEVLVQVVAALLGSGTGDIALKVGDKLEQLTHERQDLLARHLAKYDEVKARAAAHGAKVDNAARPLGMVAKERRAQVLDGVALAVFMTGSSLGVVRRRSKVVTAAPVAGSRRCGSHTRRPKQQMVGTETRDALHGRSFRKSI